MFSEKTIVPPSTRTRIDLPPIRKRIAALKRSKNEQMKAKPTVDSSETIRALKEKYFDYIDWLKTTHRHQRENLSSESILKNSLCRMGIELQRADQLVSNCKWYVYQFEKDLEKDQAANPLRDESVSRRPKNKSRMICSNDEFSSSIHFTQSKEDFLVPASRSSQRNGLTVLPAIPTVETSNQRSRRVDFDDDAQREHANNVLFKSNSLTRNLSTNFDSSSLFSVENSNKRNLAAANASRTSFRKQLNENSSFLNEKQNKKIHRAALISSSILDDEVPLGTRSQRLFGGSEYFAQVLNELDEQTLQENSNLHEF